MRSLLAVIVALLGALDPVHAQQLASRPPATPARFAVDDMLDVVAHTVLDLSRDGRWLAAKSVTERQRLGQDYARTGDPTYLGAPNGDGDLLIIETRTGAVAKPFAAAGPVKAAQWSPDGGELLALVRKDSIYRPVIWSRASGAIRDVPIPATHYVAENSELRWTPNGREIILALRTWDWRRTATANFRRLIAGPVIAMSSRDPFLGWEEQQRFAGLRSIVAIEAGRGTLRELVPEQRITGAILLSDDGTRLSYALDTLTKTPYGRSSVPGKRAAVAVVPAGADRRDLVDRQVKLEVSKDSPISWTEDGQTYVYGKEGRIFVGTLGGGAERQIAGPRTDSTKGAKAAAPNSPVADSVRARQAKENFSLVRVDPRGAWVLASNSDGFWEIATANDSKRLLVRSDTAAGTALYRFVDMTRDGGAFYFAGSQRTRWERGVYRYDRAKQTLETLMQDTRRYENPRLSADGSTLVFAVGDGSRPTELYALATGGTPRRLSTSNARFDDPRLRRTELVSYLDVDGRRQYGVLYYPLDYEAGKRYPTVLHLYEQFFDEEYEPTDKLLTGNGYLVLRPSVPSKADPGFASESWVKGATTAVNKLIEMGLADSSRLGVFGCSYGGFATSLLITQTRRFKAAVEIAGPIDLVSMYTDSPRLVLRNMNFSEAKGTAQLNMGATLWEQPQKYIQNSALMFADRITTPLLILSGHQDHNVPVAQDAEMFYAMRRLGKVVDWVSYVNGGHCMPYSSEADYKDYNRRIMDWFDRYLKKPAGTATTSEGGPR